MSAAFTPPVPCTHPWIVCDADSLIRCSKCGKELAEIDLAPATESVEQLLARLVCERDQAVAHVTELQVRLTEMLNERRRIPPLKVLRVGTHDLQLPCYAHVGDAGMDLRAVEPVTIWPSRTIAIPCGFAFAIPAGYEGSVRPRSGMAKRGLLAALGTVDSGYRGEVHVILENRAPDSQRIERGDRIAQLVISPCARCEIAEVDALDATERGNAGFGSTGVK